MKMLPHLKISFKKHHRAAAISISSIALAIIALLAFAYFVEKQMIQNNVTSLAAQGKDLNEKLIKAEEDLKALKEEDQYIINQELKERIKNVETTYNKAVVAYEKLLDLKNISKDTSDFDELFAEALDLLSNLNYATAEAKLNSLTSGIDEESSKIASAFTIPANVPESNTPPGSGYSRQSVSTEIGSYLVSIVSADLNSTRVIVDTASESDCHDNCPVLPLATYVSRNGAFAGINGSYFCPADYPSCAGKVNSFDTLLMNKNKVYFNSDNNKYSTVPLIYFSGTSAGVRGQTLDWGRDTGVDMVLANQALLLSGGNIAFGGDGDPKKGSKAGRSFVGNKGSTAYIGVVHNATVAEAAYALKALGLDNALNLDSGGSTALWSGAYRVGPGRNLPNAVLFVRK